MSASITLQITDGTTTVSLASSATNKVAEYTPATRPDRERGVFAETAKIAFRNTTLANVLTDINNTELLLRRAAEWHYSHAGARVYVVYQYDTAVSKMRALCYGGAVEYDKEALRLGIINNIFDCGVIWERGQWELETETEIALLNNGIAAKATGGVTVYNPCASVTYTTISFDSGTKEIRDSGNHLAVFKTGETIYVRGSANNNNTFTVATGGVAGTIVVTEAVTTEAAGASVTVIGSPRNYVEIAAADVTGVDPATTRIEITATTTDYTSLMWLGHGKWQTWASAPILLQAEASTDGTGAATNNATCSGGAYWTTGAIGTTDTLILLFALTAAQVQALKGRAYNILARFFTIPGSGITVTPKATMAASTTVQATGKQIVLDTTAGNIVQSLGILNLAPWLASEGTEQAIDLRLFARGAGSPTLAIDYILLMPTDSFREIRNTGNLLSSSEPGVLVDDGILDLAYLKTITGGYKTGNVTASGERVQLEPGQLQRIYFQGLREGSGSLINTSYSVRVYARMRKPGF